MHAILVRLKCRLIQGLQLGKLELITYLLITYCIDGWISIIHPVDEITKCYHVTNTVPIYP